MGTTHYSGPVYSEAGFQSGAGGGIALGAGATISVGGVPVGGQFNVTNVTAGTLAVDSTYAGKIITLSLAGGQAITLPAATGSGNAYRFLVLIAYTSSATIKVANASDTMIGFSSGSTFAGSGSFVEGVGGTDDTITLNGTTTGGLIGTYISITDFAANIWLVDARIVGSGTMVTSFSATV